MLVERINHRRFHIKFADTGVRLIDKDGIRTVVLDGDAELGTLDPDCRIAGHENRVVPGIGEVETRGNDAKVGSGRVKRFREALGDNAVDLDPEGPPVGKRGRGVQTARSGGSEILKKPNGAASTSVIDAG